MSLLFGACTSTSVVRTPPTTLPSGLNATGYVVDGVALVPITGQQRHQCQYVANQIRSPVPCPDLIPKPPASASPNAPPDFATCSSDVDCGVPQISASGTDFFLDQQAFEVPIGYIGVPGQTTSDGRPLGHFAILAGKNLNTSRVMSNPPQAVPTYCSPVTEHPSLVIHGSVAGMYECSDVWNRASGELDVGHELLVWKQDGVTCEVSFHGHSTVNQNLGVAVAEATSMLFPTRG